MKEFKLLPKEFLHIVGPAKLVLIEGEIKIGGKICNEKEERIIIKGDSISVEANKETKLVVQLGSGASAEKLQKTTIPSEWEKAAQEIIASEKPITCMIIGAVDTGKTTLTTFLANYGFEHELKVGVIDADVGQSNIGPPTTISLGFLKKPVESLSEVKCFSSFFVGSTSPAGHLLQTVTGVKLLVEKAKNAGADLILIDTTGMVHGGPARALKNYKIRLVKPNFVLALQRKDELNHLLKNIIDSKVYSLPVSERARSTSREERKFLRELAFKKYFENAKELAFNLDQVKVIDSFFGSGKSVDSHTKEVIRGFLKSRILACEGIPEGIVVITKSPDYSKLDLLKAKLNIPEIKVIEPGLEEGLVVGLLGGKNELLEIGVILKLNYQTREMKILTPLADLHRVVAIQFGSLRITKEGEELGFVQPGTF